MCVYVKEKEREKGETDRERRRERLFYRERRREIECVLECLLQKENDFTLDTNYEFLILKEKYSKVKVA